MKEITILPDDDGLRLDRWFRRYYPQVTQAELQKMLRKKLVRLDGARAESSARISTGQVIRMPELDAGEGRGKSAGLRAVPDGMVEEIRRAILYQDANVIVLNKPMGLAVQGGSKVSISIDDISPYLVKKGEDTPRLVHRLDKDTSGVLMLAKSASAAAKLTEAFRHGGVRKLYLALVVGVPEVEQGEINAPLAKEGGRNERMIHAPETGKRAVTHYRVIDRVGSQYAWLALEPITGRTHQLRVHCAMIGHPMVGDGKYGGQDAFVDGMELPEKLHLHAWRIMLEREKGEMIDVQAPLPPHMKQSAKLLGFLPDGSDQAFL